MYYKSLFEGLFEGPAADEGVRQRLRSLGNEELHARLSQVDAAAAARIHVNDTKRMVRALEVYELTGRPISSFQTDWSSGQARHAGRWFGLMWERETLNRRINARVKAMMAAGWVEETRALLERYGSLSSTAAEATGYREIMEYLQGRCSLEDAIEQIKIATRQLARRQMKWFKRFPGVHWLAGDQPADLLCEAVLHQMSVEPK
ncbi:MAG TPA: tRNA (adenosine(37)-N6)-dimethylallyltransferase MiaA [Tepidisphaeraceae bacterium]|nr:tRNA (adenosine(37)-N6)-dimethylallyltransferase MiaA [Tepidisphaeraceae bacterium]